jgi:hypothetical protein
LCLYAAAHFSPLILSCLTGPGTRARYRGFFMRRRSASIPDAIRVQGAIYFVFTDGEGGEKKSPTARGAVGDFASAQLRRNIQTLIEWNSVAVNYRTQHCECGTLHSNQLIVLSVRHQRSGRYPPSFHRLLFAARFSLWNSGNARFLPNFTPRSSGTLEDVRWKAE